MSDAFEPELLESSTGARLAVRIREAADPARGIVMVHHGMAEHGGRYARFADFLSERGFHVSAHDHRGHGRTEADDAERGVFAARNGWDKVIEDAVFLQHHLQERFPDLPLIVFGHSMGGVTGFNHAMTTHAEIAGAAVWNANMAIGGLKGVMRLILAAESLTQKTTEPDSWLRAITFNSWGKQVEKGGMREAWLSRIPEEVQAYHDDPDTGWAASISMWRDLLTGVERAESHDRLAMMRKDLPIHLAAGGADPSTMNGKAMKTFASRLYNARFTNVTMRFDPQGRHETLNDIGREQAMADFADWAGRVCAQAG
ncbi:alpha/beta hydrolase [Marinicauda salina]|uniref:Alpha/beta hydrolase n=1 Tax=Marinicauda salina TaxID=2135793 RepID=A0A2U2BVU7_9PROT|nr:alpha/beta hydrolase [Marinicauda salina]PWE18109.1 alpha/beta hydrolase [Marinicauda salina]